MMQSSMLSITLLTGGSSSEREVALASATHVASLLKKHFRVRMFDFPKEVESFAAKRRTFDAAVPMFHGKDGEDGTVQGFLRMLGVPFIFSDIAAHALALNKAWTKEVVAEAGLLVPPARIVAKGERVSFTRPCVIKPIDGGSSIGVAIAKNARAFADGMRHAFVWSDRVMVERLVVGEEYTVAVMEEQKTLVALPVIAIKPKNAFFDYQSKYEEGFVEEICPAPIPSTLARRLQRAAALAHRTIGARHLTRSDFIVDRRNRIWFLETNTIPGQTLQSLVSKAVRASGRDLADVFAGWVHDACGR